MRYGLHDLVHRFGADLVRRAHVHIQRDDVDVYPPGPAARKVFGIVRGMHGKSYRVAARVGQRRGADRHLEVSGDCSCPNRHDCEHVVAVLLGALGPDGITDDEAKSAGLEPRRREGKPIPGPWPGTPRGSGGRDPGGARDRRHETDVTRWLADVATALGRPPEQPRQPARNKRRLVYLLGRESHGPRLTVQLAAAYVRKDGSLGAAANCGYDGRGDPPRYLTPEDAELVPMLYAHARGNWMASALSGGLTLDPVPAGFLIERLLATGRCHWADAQTPPLRRGAPCRGRIEWQLDHAGRMVPRLTVDDRPRAIGLGTDPQWYVDPEADVAGPLDPGIPARAARALLAAPPLDPVSADRVRARLLELGHAGTAPLPAPAPVRVVESSPRPVPHLRLAISKRVTGWYPRGGAAGGGMPIAVLSFDYDGVPVRAGTRGETVERVVGDELRRVRRDLVFEDDAIEAFTAIGFVEPLIAARATAMLRDDLETEGTFIPMGEDVEPFLIEFCDRAVPMLREAGWVVETDDDWPYRFVEGTPEWFADVEQSKARHDWFDLDMGVDIDGERHSLLPILVRLLREYGADLAAFDPANAGDDAPDELIDDEDLFDSELGIHDMLPPSGAAGPGVRERRFAVRLDDGRLLVLPLDRVRAILGTLAELLGPGALDKKSGKLELSRFHAPHLAELDEAVGAGRLRWSGGDRLRELGRKLRGFHGIAERPVPEDFHGTLRPYQREGLSWLQFLREHGLSGVLADDMGLGKTVQVLAHLLVEKRAGRLDRPSLVVAPTSVVTNWRREAAAFAPDLRVLLLHGQDRHERFDRVGEHDLALTTYPLLARDEQHLVPVAWHALILDEAQFVKNPKTRAAAVARRLDTRHRLCLTGTPLENHLGELWSLFHILMPGLLGDARQFRKIFRTPIEKHDDRARREQLAARVRPFLLRRTKDQVARDLPPKTEITRTIELERAQRDLYESIRLVMHDKVQREIARKGLARSAIVILDALLKLRQVCCDPRLLKLERARQVTTSAKLEALMEMLEPMLDEGRRVLVFSQFTSMLRLIASRLARRKLTWSTITGDTRDRDMQVQRFQRGDTPLFLISLKAGGTGLNLTAADTVIHYDPWWNPAVEDQASDRAHRIGQDKPVFVYRLIVAGSVEEKMLALQARKRELADGVYGAGTRRSGAPLSPDDLEALFRPLE